MTECLSVAYDFANNKLLFLLKLKLIKWVRLFFLPFNPRALEAFRSAKIYLKIQQYQNIFIFRTVSCTVTWNRRTCCTRMIPVIQRQSGSVISGLRSSCAQITACWWPPATPPTMWPQRSWRNRWFIDFLLSVDNVISIFFFVWGLRFR